MQTEYSQNAKNTRIFMYLHFTAFASILGILQIFLTAFPAEFLKFPRVCPCACQITKSLYKPLYCPVEINFYAPSITLNCMFNI